MTSVLDREAEPGSTAAAPLVFSLHLDNFEGPFDLLLQLISKHKLDITEVALSRVTDEFIAHIKAMGSDWELVETSQFLVVAATLLDLKAARLLPQGDVEDEEDLALLEPATCSSPGCCSTRRSSRSPASWRPGWRGSRGASPARSGSRSGSRRCCRRC